MTVDNILTTISAISTVISIAGAFKSIKYYKKSRQLTIYANTNVAFIETQKIILVLTELLKLSNSVTKQRGLNFVKQVAAHGESIRSSINIMREKLSVEDFEDVQKFLLSPEIQVEIYVDSFISGTVLCEGKFEINEKFNLCQKAFYDIQQLLKIKIEKAEQHLS